MNLTCYRLFIAIIFLSLAVAVLPARAQVNFPGNIIFDVVQNAEIGESVTYTMRPLILGNAMPKVLTAPDGTQFGSGPFLNNQHTVATFAEFEQRFFGTWTLLEDSPISSAQDSTYTFTFNPFSLDDVFHETPVITAPTDGATAGTSFFVEWEYPSGTLPQSRTIERRQSGATLTFDPHPIPRARLDVDLAVLTGGVLDIRAGSTTNLAPYVSSISLVSGPPRSAYTMQASFRNYSPFTKVTIVPEPTVTTLIAIGSLVFANRRW